MKPIFFKEINNFFSSQIGYLVIIVYLLLNGLFLWVFEGSYNILHAGFADLNSYFSLAPWIFLFLIPAITMRSFSDEINAGTIEILKTKPIGNLKIVIGKYLAAFTLVLIAILPTLTYVYSVSALGNPVGNINTGTTIGSFLGLLFLVSTYTAIGLFSSSISKNQIVSFLIAICITFFLLYGFEFLGAFEKLGMNAHFVSIGKGVLDTTDLIYFIVLSVLFLALTIFNISSRFRLKKLLIVVGFLTVLIFVSSIFHLRWDITEDQRYTLSQSTKEIVEGVDQPLVIQVYLKGDFPSEFKRLQLETELHLEELKSLNPNINYQFINPLDFTQELIDQGLEPSTLQLQENDTFSELVIFPWAVVQYQGKEEKVSLLLDVFSNSQDEQLQGSIQNLEYAFANALKNISSEKTKKIAILKDNGALEDLYMADFLSTIGSYYHLAPFTLDHLDVNPNKTKEKLDEFDLLIVAKPTEKFSENEKFTLDQFIMNGGKSLWLIDNVHAELDSLMQTGESFALGRDLGIIDLFFNYGIRIKTDVVNDLYGSKILLATGNVGNNTQYNSFVWPYHPLVISPNNHPINKNIEAVNFKFPSSIELLDNEIKKTVLLKSSPLSKGLGTPIPISLKTIAEKPDPKDFSGIQIPLAVLLEGTFKSAFFERTKPFTTTNYLNKSIENKMVVISDGDLISNEVSKGNPLELGVNKWTNERYGNKAFLLNTVNYLLDDTGLMEVRSKSINIDYLDKERAYTEASKWQIINILIPVILILIFGFIFRIIRKRNYGS